MARMTVRPLASRRPSGCWRDTEWTRSDPVEQQPVPGLFFVINDSYTHDHHNNSDEIAKEGMRREERSHRNVQPGRPKQDNHDSHPHDSQLRDACIRRELHPEDKQWATV
jgi:hypothetical protein